jgi:SAM-dependent methyltransferase
MPDVNLFRLDARKMPFTQEYDVIGSFDVLEHIEEDEKVLSELWRATKHGLILTVPQHQFLWSAVDELGGHKRRYSAVELRAKLEKAGFTIVRMTSFVSLLLPLFVLSRLKKRDQRALDKSEFDMPVLLNRSLEVVLDIERWLLKSGINLPMGGSLLVIATKNQTAL